MSASITADDGLLRELTGAFDLSAARKSETQGFQMVTKYERFLPDGTRRGSETYSLTLRCDPSQQGPDVFTCSDLKVQIDEGSPVTIPELRGWSYMFDPTLTGADNRGPLWGIPQDRFADLTDGLGKPLPFGTRYAAYTTFIDFHSINDVFTRPMPFGMGIQDLRAIGQRVVHPASFIEAPVSFLAEVNPGSTFRNGEVTLELKGLSLVGGSPCALVGYDAGDSKLKMLIEDTVTQGDSQYKGDIYIDLATRCVRKATLVECMVAETKTASSVSAEYTVRNIVITGGGEPGT
jgi:hypothetical protein